MGKEQRISKPIFDLVVEVHGADDPVYTVVKHVANVVNELLEQGHVARPERRAPLPADASCEDEVTPPGNEHVERRHEDRPIRRHVDKQT